ncbi:hypothetical protein DPMN_130525 [Dreissena polymorpha]|uniref:Uncharacterized protein n=1 Tax=Dreissena polymorpha TaxID=45954 RepID=A0A9D4JZ85_DREPO|nr:hypothetical protein DPMN_130525 [Dreissena polymorpha]
MIEVNLPASDGDAIVPEVLERSVRIFNQKGTSEFDAVRAMMKAGLGPEDIKRVSNGLSNQTVEVVLKNKICLTKHMAVGSSLSVGGRSFELSTLNKKNIMLKIHWLPVFFDTGKLGQIFSNFGRVLKVRDEHFTYDGYQIATGVRRVLLEVEAEKMRYKPHLLNFKCGARALVTLYGRPPCAYGATPSGKFGGSARGSLLSPGNLFQMYWQRMLL